MLILLVLIFVMVLEISFQLLLADDNQEYFQAELRQSLEENIMSDEEAEAIIDRAQSNYYIQLN